MKLNKYCLNKYMEARKTMQWSILSLHSISNFYILNGRN